MTFSFSACTKKVTWWELPEFEEKEKIEIIEENVAIPSPDNAENNNNETKVEITKKEDKKPEEKVEDAPVRKIELAKCLTIQWAKMYWTSWCWHCNSQKERFWKWAFEFADFTDCDTEKEKCIEAWIQWYPTWVINWEAYPWNKTLDFLAEKAGCEY